MPSELALPLGTAALTAETDGKFVELVSVATKIPIPAKDVEIARVKVERPRPRLLRVTLETHGEVAIGAAPFAGRSGIIMPITEMAGLLSDIRGLVEGFACIVEEAVH